MPFEVTLRNDLSLAQLATLYRAGTSVQRSPHVGNVYLSNLAILAQGIPAVLYDRNLGFRDENYHPHRRISGGTFQTVCSESTLMTHAAVEFEAPDFPHGASVADCHMAALRRALPDATFCTQQQYIDRHLDLVGKVVEVVARHRPGLFYRRVTEHGRIVSDSHDRRRDPKPEDILRNLYGINNRQSGWLVPNDLNVFLDGLIEHLESGSRDIHHISGPDMVRYIGRMSGTLKELYELVVGKLGLPNGGLRFNVHAAAAFRFAVPSHRKAALDALWSGLEAYMASEKERGQIFAARGSRSKVEVIADLAPAQARSLGLLREAAAACPEVMYDIGRADFFCQYDLGQDGLYVHEEAAHLPLGEIEKRWNKLAKHCAVH